MSVEFDTSEVRALSVTLEQAGERISREQWAVIRRGALNIKAQLRAEASRSGWFGQIARSVNFDLTWSGDTAEAEIGYDKGSPGSLANVAIFGSSKAGGGTVPDPQGALDAEAPNVIEWLSRVAGELP